MPLPTARPGDAPPRVNLTDFVGCVVLLGLAGIHERMQTVNGTKDALRCFIVPISGNQAGQLTSDAMIFSSRVVGRLREIPAGSVVAGIVTQGAGRNAPVDFEPLSNEWQTYADQQVIALDAALTPAMRTEIDSFHRFEVERKDSRGNTAYATPPPAGNRSDPTVPNNPPGSGGNGMPTSAPAAGATMPALPSATLASLMTTTTNQSEEAPF